MPQFLPKAAHKLLCALLADCIDEHWIDYRGGVYGPDFDPPSGQDQSVEYAQDTETDQYGARDGKPIAKNQGYPAESSPNQNFSNSDLELVLQRMNPVKRNIVNGRLVPTVSRWRLVRHDGRLEAEQPPVGQEQTGRQLSRLPQYRLHEPKVSPDSVMLTLDGLTFGHPFPEYSAIECDGLLSKFPLEVSLSQVSPIALWVKLRNSFPQLVEVIRHTGTRQVTPLMHDSRAAESPRPTLR
jgi:hypothetical protein